MSNRVISVTVSEKQANDIAGLLAELSHPDDGGPVDLEDLLDTLIEDLSLAYRRPSSWEGAYMRKVLANQGYFQY